MPTCGTVIDLCRDFSFKLCIVVDNVTFSMNTSLFLCARATLTCWKFLREYCVH